MRSWNLQLMDVLTNRKDCRNTVLKQHSPVIMDTGILTLIVPCVTIVLLPVFQGIDTLFFFA